MQPSPDMPRGASSIIGVLLLVAVTIVISTVLVSLSFVFLDGTGAPTADASFSYERTPAGLKITPDAIGTDVVVELNGEPVAELAADSAGQSVLLPTAPGDRITIVSTDEERSVLVDRQIDDRSEVGDLIAYYPFESGSGNTILDESGNENDGTVYGSYERVSSCGSAIDFDGNSGTYINVGDLSVDGPDSIDQLTVAIRYQHDQGSDIQNLIEYQNANYAWYLETDDKFGNPHQMEYNIGYRSSPSNRIETGDIPSGPTQVLVGTHDGSQMSLYRNGAKVGTADLDRDVSLGEIILAADSDPSSVGQNLDGRLCEVRLYYTAFDEEEVDVLTEAMS